MADESFYGVTLSGEDSKVEWDVISNDEDFPRGQRLIIKQILLGAEAKEDEYNVVEDRVVGIQTKNAAVGRLRSNAILYTGGGILTGGGFLSVSLFV